VPSAPTRLEKGGILPEQGLGASLGRRRSPMAGRMRCGFATVPYRASAVFVHTRSLDGR
jgi:hypothetical protein